ncbi:MAG: OmpA family protein [Desulfobacterales bacterium]|nr:OmpA family protein [Desulfobacterales bacterium]MBF0398402.1 OmpA family protein [Desulfobacterales bacterium]
MFKYSGLLTLITILFFETGCMGRFYIPKAIPIKASMIINPNFKIVDKVTVLNVQAHNTKIILGKYKHKWSADLFFWTQTAINVLNMEFKKRKTKIIDDADKFLKLAVTNAYLVWKFRDITCTIILHAETGDNYRVNYEVSGNTKDLYESCDCAISQAVALMFNDGNILNYLAAKELPQQIKPSEKTISVEKTKDTDKDGVPDNLDKCLDTPLSAPVNDKGCWLIENVLFDFNRYDIKPKYYSLLDTIIKVLVKNPNLKMEIRGYTDNIGTEAYNIGLSEKRAVIITEYFIKKGIAQNRIHPKSFGLKNPVVNEDSDAARALNRRTEILLIR